MSEGQKGSGHVLCGQMSPCFSCFWGRKNTFGAVFQRWKRPYVQDAKAGVWEYSVHVMDTFTRAKVPRAQVYFREMFTSGSKYDLDGGSRLFQQDDTKLPGFIDTECVCLPALTVVHVCLLNMTSNRCSRWVCDECTNSQMVYIFQTWCDCFIEKDFRYTLFCLNNLKNTDASFCYLLENFPIFAEVCTVFSAP